MSAPDALGAQRRIGLGLGANLGDPAENLRRAVASLSAAGLVFDALSSLYATPPWGVTDQPDFVNACALARTRLAPLDLLDLVKATERALGREETRRWGPRAIDIDLLFYDDLAWRDDRLTLPHPGLAQRAFVLVPLAEIAPDLRFAGARLAELAARVDASGVRRLSPFWPRPESSSETN
ncbi:2-amino-4-hydroxy-6-hydroxymethyldihydropteridine diphosphokinase [Rhodoblastus acidophilus]|uniref:2-amino-4-hydroxy-6-hydroxymethyldihydropteridine pyrophosphokinase n=1 Tax=Candidatus Rhodoblastus alkanivorans TaxID=2954117 RepID=A0ABS9Z347_9HYPH|nr:2-amino-4-hydroxy-6-hydroxymethyldihydropteridine diphosphokinase [Candidatus Rhodoblastus alkanivorans]MCI4677349.1 2-amino-4-hydroxy-6-hydroxymethyldihydropteridine diphosphokinase [Candidatus Rhodoblastus alkanivorans]MCI4682084.1 2-amino-4-hydroxy-6-hydroxymethyldihydropteridine diphosphokinase [Candidatus Rhodoblastus alkanivorans]MDI4639386.1 2-amino-4-hydroxy-6-hydroxymethyldihydropteridine diphosphokinase [Rhodoblastus acidophilus]